MTEKFLIVDTSIMARNQLEVFWDCTEDDIAPFPFRAYSENSTRASQTHGMVASVAEQRSKLAAEATDGGCGATFFGS